MLASAQQPWGLSVSLRPLTTRASRAPPAFPIPPLAQPRGSPPLPQLLLLVWPQLESRQVRAQAWRDHTEGLGALGVEEGKWHLVS